MEASRLASAALICTSQCQSLPMETSMDLYRPCRLVQHALAHALPFLWARWRSLKLQSLTGSGLMTWLYAVVSTAQLIGLASLCMNWDLCQKTSASAASSLNRQHFCVSIPGDCPARSSSCSQELHNSNPMISCTKRFLLCCALGQKHGPELR